MELHQGETIVFEGHPSWRSVLGYYLKGMALVVVLSVAVALAAEVALGVLVLAMLGGALVGIGFLKRAATRYVITSERLHIRRGILSKATQETRIERVQNVNTDQSLLERILRVGTVDFDTAGTDDAEFRFEGVADPGEVVGAVDRAQRQSGAV